MAAWKTWVGMALIFVSGAGVGSVATAYTLKERMTETSFEQRGGRQMGQKFLQRMERRLDLSPEQRTAIEKILAGSENEMRSEIGPRVRDRMKKTGDEIAAVLNPEQREKFERMRDRMSRHGERGGRRGEGRGMDRFDGDRPFRGSRGEGRFGRGAADGMGGESVGNDAGGPPASEQP